MKLLVGENRKLRIDDDSSLTTTDPMCPIGTPIPGNPFEYRRAVCIWARRGTRPGYHELVIKLEDQIEMYLAIAGKPNEGFSDPQKKRYEMPSLFTFIINRLSERIARKRSKTPK